MLKRLSIFGEVSLAAVILILFVGCAPASAQTSPGETRPRSLTAPTDNKSGITHEKLPEVGSSEANARAKKLYKAGMQYGNAGLFAQAVETFQQALKLKHDYSDVYRSLGHAYIDLNKAQQA